MRWTGTLVVVALGLGGCGGAAGGGTIAAVDPAQGQQLFRQSCAMCHGMNGEGMSRLGQDLRHNAFIQRNSDDELAAFIKRGRPASDPANLRGVDMPPRGGNAALTDDDLVRIVAYLRSLQ
jgi:cytochrome c5